MELDIAALVAPLSEEAPSGPDLSYDDGRIEIESAFERSVSVDGGSSEDTDWRKVIGMITAQAEKTRDIWLPVYLMRAAAASRQFDLLVDAADYLASLVEQRWGDVHPQLDEYGFIGRKTPCESLTRIGDFLGPLARVPLIEHPRFGRFSAEDVERFAAQGPGADGYGPFRAAIEAMSAEDVEALVERFDRLRDAIRRVDAVLTAEADGDTATNFRPTFELLDKVRAGLARVLPGQDAQAAPVSDDGSAGAAALSPVAAGGPAPGGAPGGPAGVFRAVRHRGDGSPGLPALFGAYAAFEPGSPVPLVLRRAREWTTLDFLSVLEDIAPGGMDEAARVLRYSRVQSAPDGWDQAASAASDEASGGWGQGDNGASSSEW